MCSVLVIDSDITCSQFKTILKAALHSLGYVLKKKNELYDLMASYDLEHEIPIMPSNLKEFLDLSNEYSEEANAPIQRLIKLIKDLIEAINDVESERRICVDNAGYLPPSSVDIRTTLSGLMTWKENKNE